MTCSPFVLQFGFDSRWSSPNFLSLVGRKSPLPSSRLTCLGLLPRSSLAKTMGRNTKNSPPGGQKYQTSWYCFCTVRGLENGVCRQVDYCIRPSGHRLPRGRLADPADVARLAAIVSRRRLPDAQAYHWRSPGSQTRLLHVPGQKAQNFLGNGCQGSMRMTECDF